MGQKLLGMVFFTLNPQGIDSERPNKRYVPQQ